MKLFISFPFSPKFLFYKPSPFSSCSKLFLSFPCFTEDFFHFWPSGQLYSQTKLVRREVGSARAYLCGDRGWDREVRVARPPERGTGEFGKAYRDVSKSYEFPDPGKGLHSLYSIILLIFSPLPPTPAPPKKSKSSIPNRLP